jgi:hypothetical protein
MKKAKKARVQKTLLGRYLRSFTLHNVRTFRSPATLDFCQPDGRVAQWTVILGENGTGKTTLLQYLAGMLPMQAKELVNSPEMRKSVPDGMAFRPLVASNDWFGWHLQNFPRPWSKPMELTATVEVSAAAKSLDKATRSEFDAPFGFTFTTHENEDGRPTIKLNITGANDIAFYEQFRIFGYGAGRHVAGPSSPYVMSESFFSNGGNSPVGTLFHDDHPLISPEQWLLGLDHSAARAKGPSARLAKRASASAKRCLASSLPEVDEFKVEPFGVVTGQLPLTLLCKIPFSPRPVPFGSLSVGYRTMAAWLTDFVKRMHEQFPSLEEPDNGPAVLLIDEFDLHMHPRWQRQAMETLSKEFPNTQFIVTAHSPIVVQAAEGFAKILVLRRRAYGDGTEEIVVDDRPRHAANWSLEQIVEGYYGVSSRSPRYEDLLHERVNLRKKPKRTKADNAKLAEIERGLDALEPEGESEASSRLLGALKKALRDSAGK